MGKGSRCRGCSKFGQFRGGKFSLRSVVSCPLLLSEGSPPLWKKYSTRRCVCRCVTYACVASGRNAIRSFQVGNKFWRRFWSRWAKKVEMGSWILWIGREWKSFRFRAIFHGWIADRLNSFFFPPPFLRIDISFDWKRGRKEAGIFLSLIE